MQIMDPVMYSSDIKALGISDGVLSCLEGFSSMKDTTPEWDYGRSRKSDKSVVMKDTPTEWDYGRSCSSDKPVVMTPYKVTEIPRFMDRFPGGTQKTSYGSFRESLGNNFCRSQVVTSAPSFTLKASSSEEVTCSKNSSSVIDSDAWESSIIDLQLGRLSDSRTSKNCKVIHAVENLQMPESPLPTKRIKSASLVGQNPICQVLDCNMDLSSFKDYYKRHKVCEVHSKTAKVIVNDKLQRFCQQCSRFHKLSEFDDCKRSCRKRLACHNERRRKPQIDIYPVRIARMMQPSYHGLNFSGSNISDFNSLVSPDVLAYNIAMEVKTENANRLRSASSCENEPQNDVQVPVLYQHLLPGTNRHDSLNAINSASKSISYEDRNQYDLRFDASSWEFDNSLNNKAFPGISVSSCAHSLLSSQSERSSFYPLAIPVSTGQLVTPQEGNNSILQTRPTSSSSYYQSGVSTIPGDIWSKDLSML